MTGEQGNAGSKGLLQECLSRAAAYVRLASVRLSERTLEVGPGPSGVDDMLALLGASSVQARLAEVRSLLEGGCGATPDADRLADGLAGVGPGGTPDPLELLYAADREFERVKGVPFPLRLPLARAELAGAVRSLLPNDDTG